MTKRWIKYWKQKYWELNDRWNPWELRRVIERQKRHYQVTNERLASAIKENTQNKKLIETLEGELTCKAKECELQEECAKFNLKEIEQMQKEILAAIRQLQVIADRKTGNTTKLEDIFCDRCGKRTNFNAGGGHCDNCGSNLCAECAQWHCDVKDNVFCKRCSDAEDQTR